ncbi:MAG: ABC transporter ATP-binding protein [Ignavibacterium album]|uniref:ABC transporter ATP-binding protein n=1 Tax=Ignavibacterium album TaxID=591197 RepID=UPI0026EA46B8|nr:ABC transporter ATP-binding protein [Ignavibacterium album]MBI5661743.1 ABC transporter ATP-binding protein [Ignavibacterium album]
MITLDGVSKIFQNKEKAFTALKNISLSINKGEYIAVTGKSGSGKSTLLNMITGIDHPTNGRVIINDSEIGNMNESQLAIWRGKNIGIVFQFFQLIPTLTILENLLLAMEFVNVIPKGERVQRAKSLLSDVGISEQADKMPASLSGGEQQRAAIARALANNPAIIVADEPTGNLDSKSAEAVNSIFYSLTKSGKTVIVVTHEKDVAMKYDRIFTLSDGEIVSTKSKTYML